MKYWQFGMVERTLESTDEPSNQSDSILQDESPFGVRSSRQGPEQGARERCRSADVCPTDHIFEVLTKGEAVEIRRVHGEGDLWLTDLMETGELLSVCHSFSNSNQPGYVRIGGPTPGDCWQVCFMRTAVEDGQKRCKAEVTSLPSMMRATLQRVGSSISTQSELEHLIEPAVLCDNHGYILGANNAFRRLSGKASPNELKGQPLDRLLSGNGKIHEPEDSLEAYVFFSLNRDGVTSKLLAAGNSVHYEDEDAKLWLMSELDYAGTDEKEATENDLLQVLSRHIDRHMMLVRKADGVVTFVNQYTLNALDRNGHDIIGRRISELILEPFDPDVFAETIGIGSHRFTLLGADTEDVPVMAIVQQVEHDGAEHLLFLGREVGARAMQVDERWESRERADKLFQASPSPVIITREADGLILDANNALSELLGLPTEEIIGKTTPELQFWSSPESRVDLLSRLEDDGGLITDFEKEIRDGNGATRTLLFSVQRIRMNGERCLLSVGNDITRHKEAERAMKSAKEHAEEVTRFRTGILTNITHEVRTPLTVILGFTSMLRQGVREEYHRFVELIERSGRRLLLTLDSVLDLAQLEAGTLEIDARPFNIADLVSGSVEDLAGRAEREGIELSTQISTSSAYVHIDADLFHRVVDHLLDNAIKFTEDGAISVKLDTIEGKARLQVADTGIGINQEFLPHVFEAFRQESTGLERDYQGSGLGLTVSKRLIEYFGGTLNVTSQKGEGSTFTILLPLSNPDASRPAA